MQPMTEEIYDKFIKNIYQKFKEIDKFAKNLGITIYKLVSGFEIDGYNYIASDTSLNKQEEN